ncbi:hypothetical protein QUF75_12740 [Desulfococcaceae bacterium HSG7]|nr:hypothetical protein [Desulfococcaceae bacterium HSG7]
MNTDINTDDKAASPESVNGIKGDIRNKCEEPIYFCTSEREDDKFFLFEKELWIRLSEFGCMFFLLYLMSGHENLSLQK